MTIEQLIANMSPNMQEMARELLEMLPVGMHQAVADAVPLVMRAVETGDYPTFERALDSLGFGMFAPLYWPQAQMVYANEAANGAINPA